MSTIKILLADDHVVMRRGIRALLERREGFEIVAEAGDGREAIALTEIHSPDVVVVDIAMPNLNGIEAARQIVAKTPHTAVVILSMHSDESYVLRALRAGARAYLLKDSPESDLINAILAVHAGKAFFSPAISKMLVEDYVRQLQHRGQLRAAHLPRARDPATAGGRQIQQRCGGDSEPQPSYRRDAPQQYSSEVEPARHARADPVRGSKRGDLIAAPGL